VRGRLLVGAHELLPLLYKQHASVCCSEQRLFFFFFFLLLYY